MDRKSEPIERSYDVVVIGGGLAGISAAISSARLGSKVALIHDRPVLGGASSSESRVVPSGVMQMRDLADVPNWYSHSRETGIIEEIMLEHRYRNPGMYYSIWDMVLWDKVTSEPNISLYLNTSAMKAIMQDDTTISGVKAWQINTYKEFLIMGQLFIDASGDGHIAYDAGAEYRMGRESEDEFGENLAPAKADTHTMANSMYIMWRDVGRPVSFSPPKWAKTLSDADLLIAKATWKESVPEHRIYDAPHLQMWNRGWFWLEYGGMGDTIKDSAEINDELIRLAYGMWNKIKNYGEGAENYDLSWVQTVPGKRESRRFVGDYILTQNDIMSHTLFPDRVAYGGRPIDLHPPGGIYSKYAPAEYVLTKGLYSIPFRCLYSKNIKNLMMAGRNISVTHVALGSTRVQGQTAIMGEAVGVAAYLCKKYNTTPRGIYKEYTKELQQLLLKEDCFIIGVNNEDPGDLAKTAKITASSTKILEVTDNRIYDVNVFELNTARAQMFLVTEPRIESIELLLESRCEDDIKIQLRLRSAESLYDFTSEKDIVTASVVLPGTGSPQPVNQQPPIAATQRSWVTFKLDQKVDPGYYWVWLHSKPDVYWCGVGGEPIATRRVVMKNGEWRPINERGTYCFKLTPPSKPYGGENVVSGVKRPTDKTNIWISEPGLPQYVELDFGKPNIIDTIYLTFDNNLDKERMGGWKRDKAFIGGPVPECGRDYALFCDVKGSWVKLVEENGNYQRHRRHSFDAVTTRKIRLEVRATNGIDEARVYEIRCYREGARTGVFNN